MRGAYVMSLAPSKYSIAIRRCGTLHDVLTSLSDSLATSVPSFEKPHSVSPHLGTTASWPGVLANLRSSCGRHEVAEVQALFPAPPCTLILLKRVGCLQLVSPAMTTSSGLFVGESIYVYIRHTWLFQQQELHRQPVRLNRYAGSPFIVCGQHIWLVL